MIVLDRSFTLVPLGTGDIDSANPGGDYYILPVPLDDPNARFISDLTGNDSNDGTLGNPWKTWPVAFAALVPSNVLFVMDIVPLVGELDMKFVGSNLATAINSIIVTRHPDVALLDSGFDMSTGFINRFDDKHYWKFHNLTINNCGPAFIVGKDITSTGAEWKRMRINMNRGGDNTGALKFFPTANNFEVEDVTIIGPGLISDGIHANTSCLWFTETQIAFFNRLTLLSAPTPLYPKHANDNIEGNIDLVLSNIFIDQSDRFPAELNLNWAICTNWVIGANNTNGVEVSSDNGNAGGDNNTFDHFTFYDKLIRFNDSSQAAPGAVNNTLTNSVIGDHVTSDISILDLNITSDNNAFGDITDAYAIQGAIKPLATWQTDSGQDANSIDGALTFVGGLSPSSISDYALASDSIGFGTGVGADVSLCGSRV